jgi:putative DNA primase/helicase
MNAHPSATPAAPSTDGPTASGAPSSAAPPRAIEEDTIAPMQPARDRGTPRTDASTDDPQSEPPRQPAVPAFVTARFLRVGDDYYFPDRTLAFVDRGGKLKAHTHNAEVVRSLVAIAEARGWQAITVTGAEAFRRAIWHEASLRGIEVQGYRATDIERAELQRAMQRSPDALPPRAHDASAAASPEEASAREERLSGRLVEHGAAPYRFHPQGRVSYYVKLRTPNGDRTVWGVDLERALVESSSRVQVGDLVVVENRGAQRVKLKAPQRNGRGELVGERTIETHRNRWLIETAAWFAQRAEQAAALREREAAPQDLARRHAELRDAAIALWLGERFVDRRIEEPNDRDRVLAALRERLAQAHERGDEIRVPLVRDRATPAADAPSLVPAARLRQRRAPVRDMARETPPHVRE